MDTQTTTTLQCTVCGALTQAGCNCGAPYVPPAEYVMRRKAKVEELDKQGLTKDQIAAQLGVDQRTVYRDLETFDSVSNVKGQGKDTLGRKKSPGRPKGSGKPRTKPAPKQPDEPKPERVGRRGESMPTLERAREIVRPLMLAGKPFQCHALEEEHGISHYTFDSAIAAEKARLEAFEEVGALLDISKMTTKQRFDAAVRAHMKLLDREFEKRVQAETKKRTDQAFPMLDKMQREAADQERTYKELIKAVKIPLNDAEYTAVISIAHPDSRASVTVEKLMRVFQMLTSREKELALTGKNKKKEK